MSKASRKRVTNQTRSRALDLRGNATGPERVLWSSLRARQLSGLKFRRQHPIEPFIVDFFCDAAKLVIEIDGESHDGRQLYDSTRQMRLEHLGLRVLRFSNDDVLDNLDGVLQAIASAASARGANPSPSPSPHEGRGTTKPRRRSTCP